MFNSNDERREKNFFVFFASIFFFVGRVDVSGISRTCYINFLFPMIRKFFGSFLAPGGNAFSC